MKPFALFVIDADPRHDGRVVEAVRVAVGVAAWKRVDVALYLEGPAALAMMENVDDLVDADNLARYTPLLRDLGRPVYIDATFPSALSGSAVPLEAIHRPQLAALAARSTWLLRF